MKGILEYDSNNSGGDWWLSDDDWKALDAAGWNVHWGGRRFYTDDPAELLTPQEASDLKGQPFAPDEEGRWLGALAMSCAKAFESPEEGIAEWERITGQDSNAVGCPCCGPPHNFYFHAITKADRH